MVKWVPKAISWIYNGTKALKTSVINWYNWAKKWIWQLTNDFKNWVDIVINGKFSKLEFAGVNISNVANKADDATEKKGLMQFFGFSGKWKEYKPFTQSNYGKNFDIHYWNWPFYLADGTKIQNLAKHHVFPQAFERDFKKFWINIHEPKYIVPVDNLRWLEDNHSSFSKKYNAIWDKFFQDAYEQSWSSKTVKSKAEKIAKDFANDYNYKYPYN